MLESIIHFDQQLFIFLNNAHTPFLDPIMVFLSDSYIPGILILIFLALYGFKKYKKAVALVFFFTFLSIGLSDGISSKVFKPGFKRLRPCHEPAIKPLVYTAGKTCWGGKFGFVSSHAANTFSAAMIIFLFFNLYTKKTGILFIWATLVSYSRIYVAKHYPLDLLFGALLGIICALISFKLFSFYYQKIKWFSPNQ
jgi:undecaprenyl-diphosphatase